MGLQLIRPCQGYASHLSVRWAYNGDTLSSVPRTVVEIYLAGGHHVKVSALDVGPGF